MKILKVIVDEVPSGCCNCDHMESREKGRDVLWECYFVSGFIVEKRLRLPNCPLVDNFMTLDEFQAALDE